MRLDAVCPCFSFELLESCAQCSPVTCRRSCETKDCACCYTHWKYRGECGIWISEKYLGINSDGFMDGQYTLHRAHFILLLVYTLFLCNIKLWKCSQACCIDTHAAGQPCLKIHVYRNSPDGTLPAVTYWPQKRSAHVHVCLSCQCYSWYFLKKSTTTGYVMKYRGKRYYAFCDAVLSSDISWHRASPGYTVLSALCRLLYNSKLHLKGYSTV